MTETLVIIISILFLGVCLSTSWILYDCYKKLKSIEVDLMCIETRQKYMEIKQEVIEMKIDGISSLLEDIEKILPNENKEKEKKDKICYNCKFQLSDKCPNKENRSHNYTCEEFKLAWYLKSN